MIGFVLLVDEYFYCLADIDMPKADVVLLRRRMETVLEKQQT